MKLSIKIKKQKKEVEFVDNLYKKLLNELAIILNDFHRVNWKTKSWEILIGTSIMLAILSIKSPIDISLFIPMLVTSPKSSSER